MAEEIEQRQQVSSYRWIVVGYWLSADMACLMMIIAMGILLPSISKELDLSPSEQGILVSTAFFGNLVLGIPLSWWTSRYGAKTLTTVTLAGGSLCLFLQGWAPVFAVLLLSRLAFGILLIARQPARAFLIQQWFPEREIVLINSVGAALYGIVVGAGLIATPLILNSVGNNWRPVLYAFGAFLALLTILWVILGRERVTEEYRRRAEVPREVGLLRAALSYRDLWVGGFGFLGANLAGFAFLSFYPTLMLEAYDMPLQWSGTVLALLTLIGGVAGLGVGYVVMNFNKSKGILLVSGLIMSATYVAMTLTGSVFLLVILGILNGIAWGFWPILHTVPFQLPGIRPREVAVALAFTASMISAGTFLGPLATGFLHEATGDLRLTLMIGAFGALSLTAAGVLLRLETETGAADTQEVAHGDYS